MEGKKVEKMEKETGLLLIVQKLKEEKLFPSFLYFYFYGNERRKEKKKVPKRGMQAREKNDKSFSSNKIKYIYFFEGIITFNFNVAKFLKLK